MKAIGLGALLLLPLAAACDPPLCEDDVLPTELASDIVLELRGVDHANRPVFVHDRDGTLLVEDATDADGRFVLASAPGNASLTVDVPPGRFDDTYASHLVSYVGLSTGDRLIYENEPPFARADGDVSVTVRFAQLDDPRVSAYQLHPGDGCAAQLPVPHDSGNPNAVHEVTIELCRDTMVRFDVVATDAADQFIGVATASFEIGDATAVSVEVGAWQTRTATVELPAGLGTDARFSVQAHAPDGIALLYGGSGTGPLRIPALPELFDRVDVALSDATATYRISIAADADANAVLTIDATDLLPAIDALGIEHVESAAPIISWRYGGPMQAAIARYEIEESGLRRTAIRIDGGCHIAFPPLPEAYRYQVPGPGSDFAVRAGVTMAFAPDLDDVHDVLRPPALLPVGIGVATVGRSERVELREIPDPSY